MIVINYRYTCDTTNDALYSSCPLACAHKSHEDRTTVSFHNFKSQNLKSSVSNPKSKYVDYLSVLPQMSNCQGLGRKNKHAFF